MDKCAVVFAGRSRWVVFSDAVGMDYDASQVPPEWYVLLLPVVTVLNCRLLLHVGTVLNVSYCYVLLLCSMC